jgi:general L-amino acid transport system permease protein
VSEGRAALAPSATSEHVPFWQDPTKRGLVYQAVALSLALALGYYLFAITQANLRRQSIATGFSFITREAGFEIGEALLPYSSANSYARALLVGVLNTLKVSLVGIVFTIILGTIVGVARLSTNWLVSRLAAIYIEVVQNIPVLLQLYFWYAIFHDSLPTPRQSLNPFSGFFLNNRGFYFPIPIPHPAHVRMGMALALAGIIIYFLRRWARARQDRTGQIFPIWSVSAGVIIGLPFISWVLSGAPKALDTPHLMGFNFEGGLSVSPEFAALLLGLVLYTSAFVAEVVRAGIQAISRGQTEAAMSIGLKPGHVLTLIILPQALRVIIPPLTSQMLNLTKNSSLAVAIGYPDLVSVANTTINQTGQAIEGVSIIMIVYLFFSLVTSAYMNWYNKKMALVER